MDKRLTQDKILAAGITGLAKPKPKPPRRPVDLNAATDDMGRRINRWWDETDVRYGT